LIISIY